MSIVNNSITDNGGIFIYGIQDINNGRYPQTGSTSNIEVIGNTLTDTKSQWSSYIVTSDWISSPNYIWGTALDGIEVRNNSIAEGSGHPIGLWPEGYLSQVLYGDGAAPYSPNGPAPATVGTNFRGKQLHKLPSILLFDHGQKPDLAHDPNYRIVRLLMVSTYPDKGDAECTYRNKQGHQYVHKIVFGR